MSVKREDRQLDFIEFALQAKVLSFGEFKTKAGRLSPYFFNAGLFNDGASLGRLGEFYANALLSSKIEFDMLYGPAYKGITLAASTAIALARSGRNIPFAYNRKEAKDHGEGGTLIGAPVSGQVIIVDDVISAGTSVRESVDLISASGAKPCAVLIALDRMEKSGNAIEIGQYSAVQSVGKEFGLPVISIANLDSVMNYLAQSHDEQLQNYLPAVKSYRARYGV
jgi:orotate phosphoribosyltransferase